MLEGRGEHSNHYQWDWDVAFQTMTVMMKSQNDKNQIGSVSDEYSKRRLIWSEVN